jgi:hypothetical protein
MFSCLASSLTLKMEAICYSDTFVDFHRFTRRYMAENRTLRSNRCEKLKI